MLMTVALPAAAMRKLRRVAIREVMAAQSDLGKVLGQFDPKLVKMATAGERPED